MSFALAPFAAILLAAAPAQEAPDGDWPLDPDALGDDWATASAYFAGQRAECTASGSSPRRCLGILYRQAYAAEAFGEDMAAAKLSEEWLQAAEPLGLLGGLWEVNARYRYGISATALARSDAALPRPALQLAIEQLTRAIEVADGLDDAGWPVLARQARADALARLAAEQGLEQRRLALWQLAADDLVAAIERAATVPSMTDYMRGEMQADLSRAMLELGVAEEAALAADAAIASFRKVVADEPDDLDFIADRIRQLALRAQEAGFPRLAIAYYGFVLDLAETDPGILFSVSDLLTLAQAHIDNGEAELAVELYGVALVDPGFTAVVSNEAFLRGGLLRAMAAAGDFASVPGAAQESIAFADAAIARGDYAPPLEAMKMHARAAWGEALVALGKWAEAEPVLAASRAYRVRMAFHDPTEPDQIAADLLLAKAISRGSGDFATARTLLKDGMAAAVAASRRGSGFDTGSEALLRSYAPLFREQVRIAFALAKPGN